MSRVHVIEIIRRGPPGPPGSEGDYYTETETDALLADKADAATVTDGLAAKLNTSDVLNEPDMATGATDKPPSQASVKAALGAKLDDTLAPALLLSPDASRNRYGTVTPTITGTVTTVAGQYGDAWSLDSADAAVSVPMANHWDTGKGTVLVRSRFADAPTGTPYSLWTNSTAGNRFRMGISSANVPRIEVGDAFLLQSMTDPPDFSEMFVHAVRYDNGDVQQFIDGEGLAPTTYTGTAGTSGDINLAILIADSTPFDVESVLIFPGAIPDSEIARLSTMDEAWTWESARLQMSGFAELTAHLADTNNPHEVTKEDVGLGEVDNSSDLAKPVSTAVQEALDQQAVTISTHTATLANHATVMDAHGAIIVPDAVRYEGDILWVGPEGPQWHSFDDVLNGVNTPDRYGYGQFGDGEMPE